MVTLEIHHFQHKWYHCTNSALTGFERPTFFNREGSKFCLTDMWNARMEKNYYTLEHILNLDWCQLDGYNDTMTSLSQVYEKLSNVLKKTLYDMFLSQTNGEADHPKQTYQEW